MSVTMRIFSLRLTLCMHDDESHQLLYGLPNVSCLEVDDEDMCDNVNLVICIEFLIVNFYFFFLWELLNILWGASWWLCNYFILINLILAGTKEYFLQYIITKLFLKHWSGIIFHIINSWNSNMKKRHYFCLICICVQLFIWIFTVWQILFDMWETAAITV